MEFDRNIVAAGKVALETFTAGTGTPPVCTTHAFNPATSTGGLAAEALARITVTVAVNLRSLGASDPGHGAALSLEQAVHDLEAVRVALGYDRWVYAGGSAGGFVGLHYALMFPGSLEALILV